MNLCTVGPHIPGVRGGDWNILLEAFFKLGGRGKAFFKVDYKSINDLCSFKGDQESVVMKLVYRGGVRSRVRHQ